MLKVPAPFPHAGSYALYETGRRTELVRIQYRGVDARDGMALVSFVGGRRGTFPASGNKLVPLADLIDGTPLSDAERAEYVELERAVIARARPNPKKLKRFMALRERDIRSNTLAEKLRFAGVDEQIAA